MFGDVHGIVIVVGGTASVALLSFPLGQLALAFKVLLRKMFLGGGAQDYLSVIDSIVKAAAAYRANPRSALESMGPRTHPFLKDGMRLLVEYGFNHDDLDAVMGNALDGKKKRDQDELKVWHTLSRFPPAFGLLGATVGMISLLQTLGEPGAQDRIGPAMATALVATFYGLTVANFLLIPITENLAELSRQDVTMRNIIKEGVLLIQEKRHPLYIEEYLKSFLPPRQRGESKAK
ncbi:MAG: MotA/TolQ/ExbB proton channel family protein [Bdellovibrionales bacterium]|nr:MotA/TolQ/ExbB proton channel family protein [Bdellovibrionales bacterium]